MIKGSNAFYCSIYMKSYRPIDINQIILKFHISFELIQHKVQIDLLLIYKTIKIFTIFHLREFLPSHTLTHCAAMYRQNTYTLS